MDTKMNKQNICGINLRLSIVFFLVAVMSTSEAVTFHVGPQRTYKAPSEVASFVNDGDIIEVDAGVYFNDVTVWRKNNLTIRGNNGRAHIQVNGTNAEGKGIWVVKGNNTLIENVEFSGAKAADKNGAGIRLEGTNLTVRKCYFHDNENGILTGKNPVSEINIEYSEFSNNGHGDGYSHNIYIGEIRKFTMQFSYSHHAKIGHQVKSRAHSNYLLYNRLMDERNGTSSYIVDLPNGGDAYLIGNIIQQGKQSQNYTLVSFGAENPIYPESQLYVINNSFINDYNKGIFINIAKPIDTAKIINNLFVKDGSVLSGSAQLKNNLQTNNPGLKSLIAFDYRPLENSPVIDKGTEPGIANGFGLLPKYQYHHKIKSKKRIAIDKIDIGAYEYTKSQ